MKKFIYIPLLAIFLMASFSCGGDEKCTVTASVTSGSTTATTTTCSDSDCNLVVTTDDGTTSATVSTVVSGCSYDADACSGTSADGLCK